MSPAESSLWEHRHQNSISFSAVAFNPAERSEGMGEEEEGCRGGRLFLFKNIPPVSYPEKSGKKLALFVVSRKKEQYYSLL